MDIAFISSHIYPFSKGGTEKRVYEIGRRLADWGHEVTVYGVQWWDGPSEIRYENMRLRGVSPNQDQYSGDRRSIFEALRFSKNLAMPLQRHGNEHDLLVASVSEHFPVWIAGMVARTCDTPLVTTWHEVWEYEYWKEYLGSLGPFGWAVQSITAKLPQRPIAVSPKTADRLTSLGQERDAIEVIPNGVDVELIRSTPPAEDGFDVLFVGRLIPEKNADLLLEAFDQVADEYDVTLGVIGDGTEFDALQAQASSMNHSDSVSFLGFVEDDEEVYAHMRAADLFVLPSVREGFGITVLEAMAAGCRPITVSHPDSAASQVSGDCGLTTEADASSIASAIRRVLEGDVPDRDPVERAREFDWDRIARSAERVYAEAIEEPVRPSSPSP